MPALPVDPLTIAVAQPRCTPSDLAANAREHVKAVHAAEARVVVFPELSLTGYELDAPAISPDDPRIATVVEACAATGSIALAGAPIRDETGREFIATVMIDASGMRTAYRKMRLHGVEAGRFSAGTSPAIVEVDGWRLGLAICKDTSTAEHAVITAELGIHTYVASVLEHIADASRTNQRARRVATDHNVWVASASFAGDTGGFTPAAGGSSIVSPRGIVLDRANSDPGCVVSASLDPHEVPRAGRH